ncbi:hypothetical protein HPB50_012578 [Hyalomma asiaticum]|uniref:Uncharacterized protein n=1 Tax=Hyalomma asiaticum TaxID=266040 RepID=A0ACB7RZ49_HYAAI|nr:hypothetical protein HPB50_012578 [Hyalomma asiaticum]
MAHFGLLLDIDGVIVRGRKVISHAVKAFQKLVDSKGRFRVPTIFVTNAGNSRRQDKADQLSKWLGVHITEQQVVMSHSPLRMFQQFHDKHCLISGQGPIVDIAHGLGFRKVSTIDHLRSHFPLLDAVDHKRRQTEPSPYERYFPRVEAVVLFGEPVRWETSLQLIIDVLMTNGLPCTAAPSIPYPHLPILACNMDLQWMAEACLPSDNINTDIYGANLYNRYLERRRKDDFPKAILAAGSNTARQALNSTMSKDSQSTVGMMSNCGAVSCTSVLVHTGVYNEDLHDDACEHTPRDFLPVEVGLKEPVYRVDNIHSAIELIFEQEGFS